MFARKLEGLEPALVFKYFEEICAIPHGSGNTKAISDYLVAFAQEQGIDFIQDQLNNVILFAPGTCGMDDHQPVIIQGHMDMVCEKDENCSIDMEKEGLDIGCDGQWIYANGTTLGGDDGIAVAVAMALIADKSIAHPPLEVVITVDEETGMDGATGIDLSMLKGNKMLNIDSEEEGIFTVSCAGGCKSTISMPVSRRAVYGPCVKLTVEGLRGGHSGVMIHEKRANANKVMAEFLSRIQKIIPVAITKLSGGAKDNAIPRSCQVTLVALGMYIDRINGIAEQLQEEIRAQYDEPDVIVRGDDVDALGGNAISTEDSARLIALMNSVPNGVQSWSADIQGLVQTSLNLGIAELSDTLKLTFAVRSSVEQEKRDLLKKLSEIAAFYNAEYTEKGDYPAWEYRKDSPLRDTMIQVYEEMFGSSPDVVAIHAGLECGLLGEKISDLDCVSIGPNMQDIHTSREKLEVSSTERMWRFIVELLGRM